MVYRNGRKLRTQRFDGAALNSTTPTAALADDTD